VTIREFFAKVGGGIELNCTLSVMLVGIVPWAQRAWEGRIAREAAAICERYGGTALLGEDRVVSCMPASLSNGRLP